MIGIDSLEVFTENGHRSWIGKADGRVKVAFPIETDYRLIARSLVSIVTPVEAAQRQKAEEQAVAEILGPEEGPEETPFNAAAYR